MSRVKFVKAGICGAGGGSGVLTVSRCDYPSEYPVLSLVLAAEHLSVRLGRMGFGIMAGEDFAAPTALSVLAALFVGGRRRN